MIPSAELPPAGPWARVLVDTGHHLPGRNIELIVAVLVHENMLGGFHFNDRKYAAADLTMGTAKPPEPAVQSESSIGTSPLS